MRTTLGILFVVGGLAMYPAWPAQAEDWPTRPVRLIVPFPAGGGTDNVARIVAKHLEQVLGQPIVVDNRGGAGGAIGSDAVAKAAPDGYTLGIATSSTLPAAVVLQKGVPYDPVAGFAQITRIGTTPYILVSGNDVPAKTLSEFTAYVKANPGKVSYASVGVTTLGYLLTEQFKILAGVNMLHVPYRGAAQAYPDLIANRVQAFLDNPTGSAGFVKDGKMRAYAVTARSAVLPDVPTFAEAGVNGFDTVFWYGLVAPPDTPRPIIDRIQREVAQYVQSSDGRAELLAKDVTPLGDTPEAFKASIAADIAAWRKLTDRLGIKPE
jgi:tripartite-type tricarboxylate transporter receptor subunit TctC